MRITNKIMQKNNLSNINTNKIYQDKLTNQMSSKKKITRPSEDPVVAIRALRLRSNVTEITQYYSKNIPDAESWLKVTEDGLKNLTDIITDMIGQCTKAANGDLTSADKQIILEQLKALGDEVYSTGDADYAGRYVFTGYRTDTSLSFLGAETTKYTITEQLDSSALDTITKVNTDDLLNWNANNYNAITATETDVSSVEAYRIRLAYADCDEGGTVNLQAGVDPATGDPLVDWAGIQVVNSYTDMGGMDPYTYVSQNANKDKVLFLADTGELLMGADAYSDLSAVKDNTATLINEGEIRITYEKSKWQDGDLRPEHYFYCTAEDAKYGTITYNEGYLKNDAERQVIEYDVGFNQTIQVNSTADKCFKHGIGREVDDLVAALEDVVKLEEVQGNIEALLKEIPSTDTTGKRETLQKQLDAAEKALTLARDKCQKMFESGITELQGYLDDTNLCITECGTRSSKLELIENRMQNQKTTFETLKSENEDIDVTEVAIQLSSAELTYQAALLAAGKVMQTTLLNYI